MKHAFLITAYNEPEILKHELKMLDHAKVDVFIHIDKKADLSTFDFLQNICKKSHVYVVDKNIDVLLGRLFSNSIRDDTLQRSFS